MKQVNTKKHLFSHQNQLLWQNYAVSCYWESRKCEALFPEDFHMLKIFTSNCYKALTDANSHKHLYTTIIHLYPHINAELNAKKYYITNLAVICLVASTALRAVLLKN